MYTKTQEFSEYQVPLAYIAMHQFVYINGDVHVVEGIQQGASRSSVYYTAATRKGLFKETSHHQEATTNDPFIPVTAQTFIGDERLYPWDMFITKINALTVFPYGVFKRAVELLADYHSHLGEKEGHRLGTKMRLALWERGTDGVNDHMGIFYVDRFGSGAMIQNKHGLDLGSAIICPIGFDYYVGEQYVGRV